MKIIYFFLFILITNNCSAQPPFSSLYRRPNIHPYTFLDIDSNAMDYQQMFYLTNKYEYLNINQKPYKKNETQNIYVNPSPNTIRPTGHKTYFMNLP